MQKILTLLNPELAHNLTINILSKTGASPLSFFYRQPTELSPVEVMGLRFRNRAVSYTHLTLPTTEYV